MNGYEKASTRRESSWKTSSRVRFAEDRSVSAVGKRKEKKKKNGRIIGTWGWMGRANLAWRFARIAHALCALPPRSRFRFAFISPHSTSCRSSLSFLLCRTILCWLPLPFPLLHPLLCLLLFSRLKVLLALPSSSPLWFRPRARDGYESKMVWLCVFAEEETGDGCLQSREYGFSRRRGISAKLWLILINFLLVLGRDFLVCFMCVVFSFLWWYLKKNIGLKFYVWPENSMDSW